MDGGKQTKRQTLKQVYKTYRQSKRDHDKAEKIYEELNPEPPTTGTVYLVNWYHELKREKSLSFTEIRNWALLLNINIKPFEVRLLIELDNLYYKVKHGE